MREVAVLSVLVLLEPCCAREPLAVDLNGHMTVNSVGFDDSQLVLSDALDPCFDPEQGNERVKILSFSFSREGVHSGHFDVPEDARAGFFQGSIGCPGRRFTNDFTGELTVKGLDDQGALQFDFSVVHSDGDEFAGQFEGYECSGGVFSIESNCEVED